MTHIIYTFLGSTLGTYIVYHYISKNWTSFLYLLGKSEAYCILFTRYMKKCLQYTPTLIEDPVFKDIKSDDLTIEYKNPQDNAIQCRVNNISNISDICTYKFMLIEINIDNFNEKIAVSLENKDDNYTIYISNNKLDRHFWLWYLSSQIDNKKLKDFISDIKDVNYTISIMDHKYKHIVLNIDDIIWMKKSNYEIIKNGQTITHNKENKIIHRKRNKYWSDDEERLAKC